MARRTAVVMVAVATVLAALAGAAGVAVADPDRNSRFDPRVARLRIEDRLARQGATSGVQVEYSTPYLPASVEDRSVDARIRRLGELIRQREQEERLQKP